MSGILRYFVALASTALIGVGITSLIKDQKIRTIVQTVVGVLLLLVILRPLSGLDLQRLAQEVGEALQKELETEDYETLYRDRLSKQVRQTTENYILKKAESLSADISVQVEVSDEGYPSPNKVRITGVLTGEQRKIMEAYITQELGISTENQRWELYGERN